MRKYDRESVMSVAFIIFIIAVALSLFTVSDPISAVALVSGTIVAFIMIQEYFE